MTLATSDASFNFIRYYSMEHLNIQKGENEYIVELKIDCPLKLEN